MTLDSANDGFYFSDPGESSDVNPIGTVHYVDSRGTTHLCDGELAFPDGIVLTPDGKKLYLAESKKNRVLVYDVLAPGKIGNRQVFADLPTKNTALGQIDNQPDGMCLDADGNLYVAHYGMQQVQVLDPTGKLVRRYGGDPYNGAVGGRIEATYYPSGKTAISGSLAAQRVRYALDTGRNGGSYALSGSVLHTLDAASGMVVKGGVARQTAAVDALANTSLYAAIGYFRDLPGGFTIYAEPSFSRSTYDAILPAFGVAREDDAFTGTLTLLNRHIVLGRFTPKISYSYTHQDSNVALYDYRRNRIEIGLTTAF